MSRLTEIEAERDKIQTETNARLKELDAEEKKLRKESIKQFREETLKKAAELGTTVEDVFGVDAPVKKTRPPVEPKYRNPEKPEQTWTGRGRAPRWVVDIEEAGGSRERLLIK